MTLKEKVLKLQTYKMFEGEDTVYVERDDILELLEQEPCEDYISREKLDKALYERFHEEDSPNNITNVHLGAVRNFVQEFPSVNPQPKTDVLDKIKAEIERERSFQRAIDEYDVATGLRKALEILDKYKAESEDKE